MQIFKSTLIVSMIIMATVMIVGVLVAYAEGDSGNGASGGSTSGHSQPNSSNSNTIGNFNTGGASAGTHSGSNGMSYGFSFMGDAPGTADGGDATTDAHNTVTTPLVPSCTLTASKDTITEFSLSTLLKMKPTKTTTITKGDSVVLTVYAKNARKVKINYGVGYVGRTSSHRVSPASSRTYVATVYGYTSVHASCIRGIVVKAETAPVTPIVVTADPECELPYVPGSEATISCNPNKIELGQKATVRWWCGNGATNTVAGGTSGSYEVGPIHPKRYTVTCGKGAGASYQQTQSSCIINVGDEVLDETLVFGGGDPSLWPDGFAGVNQVPTVDIKALPVLVRSGQNTTVTWVSHYAANCQVIGPGVSSATSNGSKAVAITEESTFTISCDGNLKDSVTVRILPDWNEQ